MLNYSNRYVLFVFLGCASIAQAGSLGHLSATSLEYGAQDINTIGSPKTVTLSNTGDANLVIRDMKIFGEFSLGATYACYNSASGCAKPVLPCSTISPGQGCTFNVWYTPVNDPGINQTQKYTAVGSLQFTTNAGDSNTSVALTGTTNQNSCTVTSSVAPISFATTQIGAASVATQIIPITAGASPLPLAISVNGDFSQTNDCTTTPLPANSACNITVTFNPTLAGTRNGNIYFNNLPHVCGFADALLQGFGSGTNLNPPANAGTPVNPTLPAQADPNAGKDTGGTTDKTTDIKGCTIGRGGAFDPILLLLTLIAVYSLNRHCGKRVSKLD
ncbi:MAG: choice-of-anchor D domain-containing protein [Burkholderiales bacterium]